MATEGGHVIDLSFTASADLSSNQFYIVRSSAADEIGLCVNSSNSAARAIGVLQNDPGSGQAGTVRVLGYSKVSASAAISYGAPLTCTTGGQAVTAGTTGQWVFGFADSASTAAGQVITAWVQPGWMWSGSTA